MKLISIKRDEAKKLIIIRTNRFWKATYKLDRCCGRELLKSFNQEFKNGVNIGVVKSITIE
jgi:hypothetical protein